MGKLKLVENAHRLYKWNDDIDYIMAKDLRIFELIGKIPQPDDHDSQWKGNHNVLIHNLSTNYC